MKNKIIFFLLLNFINLSASEWDNESSFFEDHQTAVIATASFIGGITLTKLASWYSSYRNKNSLEALIKDTQNKLNQFKDQNHERLNQVIGEFKTSMPTELITLTDRLQQEKELHFNVSTKEIDEKAKKLDPKKDRVKLEAVNKLKQDIAQLEKQIKDFNNVVNLLKEYQKLDELHNQDITSDSTLNSILENNTVFQGSEEHKLQHICQNFDYHIIKRKIEYNISSIQQAIANLNKCLQELHISKISNEHFNRDRLITIENCQKKLKRLNYGKQLLTDNKNYLDLFSLFSNINIEYEQEIEVIVKRVHTQENLDEFNSTIESRKSKTNQYPFTDYRDKINKNINELDNLIKKIDQRTELFAWANTLKTNLCAIAESIDNNRLQIEAAEISKDNVQKQHERTLERQHKETIEREKTEQERIKRDQKVRDLEHENQTLLTKLQLAQMAQRDYKQLNNKYATLKTEHNITKTRLSTLRQRILAAHDLSALQQSVRNAQN